MLSLVGELSVSRNARSAFSSMTPVKIQVPGSSRDLRATKNASPGLSRSTTTNLLTSHEDVERLRALPEPLHPEAQIDERDDLGAPSRIDVDDELRQRREDAEEPDARARRGQRRLQRLDAHQAPVQVGDDGVLRERAERIAERDAEVIPVAA